METIGGLSGATLGYIVGNTAGAYYGYRIGSYYGRNMPPITRRRAQAGRRILSAMRGWRARGYAGGATERILSGLRGRRVARRSNNVTTQQKDYTTQYLKKRMPKKGRKQWKKFVKKVTAVEIKNAALKTVVFNNKLQNTSGAGLQNFMSVSLYGVNGVADGGNTCGNQDLLKVFDNDPDIQQQAVGSPAAFWPSNGKLHFNTAILDMTIRNLGEADSEVDVYYGYHVKDGASGGILAENPGSLHDEFALALGDPIKSGNTTLNLAMRGVTPFDLSRSLSSSGFHVIKKQKLMIEPGKTVFIQHRDAKNYELDQNFLSRINGYAVKKLTYQVLIVHKAAVSSTDLASTIAVGCTRKFNYTVLARSNQPVNASNPPFNPAA